MKHLLLYVGMAILPSILWILYSLFLIPDGGSFASFMILIVIVFPVSCLISAIIFITSYVKSK